MTVARAAGFWVLAMVVFGIAGCSSAPKHREPTPEEWEHALDGPLAAGGRSVPAEHLTPHPPSWVAPRLVQPPEDHMVSGQELEREQGLCVFSWSAAGLGARYELEIARDRNFVSIEKRLALPRAIALVRGLGDGTHFWRVRVLSESGARVDLESNVQRFRL